MFSDLDLFFYGFVKIHGNAKENIITDDLNCIISIFERGKAFYFSSREYDDFSFLDVYCQFIRVTVSMYCV